MICLRVSRVRKNIINVLALKTNPRNFICGFTDLKLHRKSESFGKDFSDIDHELKHNVRQDIKFKSKAAKWLKLGETVQGTHNMENGTVQRYRSMYECEKCGEFVKKIQYRFHGYLFDNMILHQIFAHDMHRENTELVKILVNNPIPSLTTDNLNMRKKQNCRCSLEYCSYCAASE